MKTIAVAILLLASSAAAVAAEATPTVSTGYVPCKVHQKVAAEFPARMLYQGVMRGEASAVLEIGTDGKIADRLVTQYTQREFADEMMRAINGWAFEPGYANGKPVTSIVNVTFEFTISGVAVYERQITSPNSADSWLDEKYAYYAHGPETLDQKPVPIQLAPPIYPNAWMREGRSGKITIQFYIDENGQARLPAVVNDGDGLLAGAAVAAVKQWKFERPMRRGQPVLARAEQEFVFQKPIAKAD